MGRSPCCSKVGLRRGPWTLNEDDLLIHYIQTHGEGHWRSLPKKAGLLRCGKSCRLRWMNYLRPDIKRGNITPDEEDLIIRMHSLLGNRWSLIAGRLPGRTDNEIKNYWNSHLSKRVDIGKSRSSTGDKAFKGSMRRNRNDTRGHKNAKEIMSIEKIKVHQPKATRVSLARTSTLRAGMSSSSNNRAVSLMSLPSSEANKGTTRASLEGPEEDDNTQYDNLLISSDCDFICSSSPWQGKDLLEKIYEEYKELLMADDRAIQLESFVDSLLI